MNLKKQAENRITNRFNKNCLNILALKEKNYKARTEKEIKKLWLRKKGEGFWGKVLNKEIENIKLERHSNFIYKTLKSRY